MREREELLLRDEQLRNADRDIDPAQRKSIEDGVRITRNRAGQLAFNDNHLDRAGQRLDVLMNFLRYPATKLTDEELKFRIELLEDRGKSARYLASLLRIYTPGVWYDRFSDYLRQYVVERWKASSVKNTKKFKKII